MTVESAKDGMKEGALIRQGFGQVESLERRGETAATAVAAQAQAMVQARYVVAFQNPRNWMDVRSTLRDECKRPEFANNKSAIYRKPIGAGIEGLGIRFVEVALRCMKNILVEAPTVYEDDRARIVRVSVTDLEANITHFKDVVVNKTVERKSVPEGVTVISTRKNSSGDFVHLIPATDDELLNKEAALISKALRTQGLRLIPGDLQDECEEIIRAVRKDKAAKDPKAEQKAIADAFAGLNVKVSDLEKLLEHPLDQCTPAELVDLRGLYGALADGETSWKAVMENKADWLKAAAGSEEDGGAKKRGVAAAKDKVKEEKTKEETAPVTTKVAETKPAETKAAETKPAEAAPAETAPVTEVKQGTLSEAIAEPETKAAAAEEAPTQQAEAESDDLLPEEQAEEPKGKQIRKIQFPARLTRNSDDPPVDEAVLAECRAESDRLKQNLDKISVHWLQTPFGELNEEAVKCLTKAFRTVPTAK